MTVTDSRLPYTFEVGMRVTGPDGQDAFVTSVTDSEPALDVVFGTKHGRWVSSLVVADIDHPGTRGLLLAQYRESSGSRYAVAIYSDGEWLVDPDATSCSDSFAGRGESEGAAILDALTRLAASKAEAAVEPVVDGDCHRRVDALAGRINVLDAKLARMDATLANIADRMANLDGMGAQ